MSNCEKQTNSIDQIISSGYTITMTCLIVKQKGYLYAYFSER